MSAGKHRKRRARRSPALRRLAPGLTAAAISATSLTTALSTGTTVAVSPAVELTALITPANSTAQVFASSDYYGVDWVGQYGQPQVVPFFLGPQGIVDAIDKSYANDPNDPIAVLASGWGAGQTGTAIAIMKANNDPALNSVKIVVLDNNTNRAAGGFWTTYAAFAPLLFTSAAPTPSNTGIPILDVAYVYNINSSAPTDPLNPFADANSLVAYLYGYGGQANAPVPDYIIAEAENTNPNTAANTVHYHYVLDERGNVIEKIPLPVGTTSTYVTFKPDHLPLVRPLLLLPGGDIVAAAIEPTLTFLVNAGYKDSQPIPEDPTVPRPMEPGSSITNILAGANTIPLTVQEGAQNGVAAAQHDVTNPANLVTGPLNEIQKTAGILTNNSPIPLTSSTTQSTPSTQSVQSVNPFTITTQDKGSAAPNSTTTSSSGRTGPIRQVFSSVTSALRNLAGSLTGQKNSSGAPSGSTPSSP